MTLVKRGDLPDQRAEPDRGRQRIARRRVGAGRIAVFLDDADLAAVSDGTSPVATTALAAARPFSYSPQAVWIVVLTVPAI